jgi:hypothetical protein
MSDEQNQTPDAESGGEDEAKKDTGNTGNIRNDIVETAIGLAVLGLGAAVVSGGLGLGGIMRTLTRGVPAGTPPIRPSAVPPRPTIR